MKYIFSETLLNLLSNFAIWKVCRCDIILTNARRLNFDKLHVLSVMSSKCENLSTQPLVFLNKESAKYVSKKLDVLYVPYVTYVPKILTFLRPFSALRTKIELKFYLIFFTMFTTAVCIWSFVRSHPPDFFNE